MLKDILAISGKPGLYKLLKKMPNAFIVESISDKKRFPVYADSRVLSLEDISIYTNDGELPLRDIYKRFDKETDSLPTVSKKSETKTLVSYFESIVPEYDKSRVYASDIKKVLQWYKILSDNRLLHLIEEEKGEE